MNNSGRVLTKPSERKRDGHAILSRGKRRVYPGHLQFCRKCPIWDTRTFRCVEKLLNKLHWLKTKDSFLRCFTKVLRHKLLKSCLLQAAPREIILCTGLCRNELIYKLFETFLVLLKGGVQVKTSVWERPTYLPHPYPTASVVKRLSIYKKKCRSTKISLAPETHSVYIRHMTSQEFKTRVQ